MMPLLLTTQHHPQSHSSDSSVDGAQARNCSRMLAWRPFLFFCISNMWQTICHQVPSPLQHHETRRVVALAPPSPVESDQSVCSLLPDSRVTGFTCPAALMSMSIVGVRAFRIPTTALVTPVSVFPIHSWAAGGGRGDVFHSFHDPCRLHFVSHTPLRPGSISQSATSTPPPRGPAVQVRTQYVPAYLSAHDGPPSLLSRLSPNVLRCSALYGTELAGFPRSLPRSSQGVRVVH